MYTIRLYIAYRTLRIEIKKIKWDEKINSLIKKKKIALRVPQLSQSAQLCTN